MRRIKASPRLPSAEGEAKFAVMRMIILGILAAGISVSHAGEKIGNGGGAWVCAVSSGSWKWVRQIDLYEGVTEYHLPIREQTIDPVTQVGTAIQKLSRVDEALARDYSLSFMNVRAKMKLVRAELELIDDSLYRIRPYATECAGGKIEYIQVANFKEDGEILVREDVWNHPDFSASEQTALYLHEAIYADLRAKYGETNSTRARHLVALLLSDLSGAELGEEVKRVLNATPDPTRPMEMKFVTIPAGTYTLGSAYVTAQNHQPPSGPELRKVRLEKPFEILTTEFTEYQYFRIYQVTSSSNFTRRANCPHNFVVVRTEPYERGYCPNLPANLSLSSVTALANRLTELDRDGYKYRLPTGDEWEIAARAGAQTTFATGDDPSSVEGYAVLSNEVFKRTQPMDVASMKPNAFGLYDMLGNVRELAAVPGSPWRAQVRGCGYSDYARLNFEGQWSSCSEAQFGEMSDPIGGFRFIREKR